MISNEQLREGKNSQRSKKISPHPDSDPDGSQFTAFILITMLWVASREMLIPMGLSDAVPDRVGPRGLPSPFDKQQLAMKGFDKNEFLRQP